MKKCNKCGLLLSKENFRKNKLRKDGFFCWCKKCTKIYNEERYKNNEEISRERSRNYYKKNKEKKKKHNIEYLEKNKEKIKEYAKIYRGKNSKKLKDLQLKYYYNISLEEWNNIFNEQEKKCAICGKISKDFKCSFSVDHCHSTGKIRGLLCSSCNLNLGYYEKYKEKFEEYLTRETNYGYINDINDIKEEYE